MKFVRYTHFVGLAGLSQHVRQLERRQCKYPQHFKTVAGEVYISQPLALALVAFNIAAIELDVLLKGGVQ